MMCECIMCEGRFQPWVGLFGDVVDDVCSVCASEQEESRQCGAETGDV